MNVKSKTLVHFKQGGSRWYNGTLSQATLERIGVEQAVAYDIDTHNPRKGFFNARTIHLSRRKED